MEAAFLAVRSWPLNRGANPRVGTVEEQANYNEHARSSHSGHDPNRNSAILKHRSNLLTQVNTVSKPNHLASF
jgi:hypothetical protein